MHPPTEADWESESWGIDTPSAYRHFGGKSHAEAVAMFEDNALLYQEDILFMPCACFRFYVRAYAEYILSPKSAGDGDAASCFIGCIDGKISDCREAVIQNRDLIKSAFRRIADGQAFFAAKEDIYGNFQARVDEVLQKLRT